MPDRTKPAQKPAQTPAQTPARPALLPAGPRLLSNDPDLHLLRRLTYGPLQHTLDEVRHVSRGTWQDRQLSPGGLADPNVDALLAPLPLAAASPTQIRASIPANNQAAIVQLQLATMVRAIWSTKQFYERVVEHWHERLHATSAGGTQWDVLPQRDQLLRTMALGRFADLLAASTRDPALLRVLSADTSRGANPNQNLGRELLELHTVGTGAYSEVDVQNSALTLTGLTIAADGTPAYNPKFHYVGPVQVMGWSHPNGKTDDGNVVIAGYLDYLARHPLTAVHVSTRLAQRFVSDTPDPSLVADMAAAFTRYDTDITSVLKVMIAHKAFAASAGRRTRTPYESAIAAVRALRCQPVGVAGAVHPLSPLLTSLAMVGAAPTSWPTPEGAHTDAASVSSAAYTLAKWNLHQQLTTNTMPGLLSPAVGLLGAVGPTTPVREVVDRALRALLLQDVTTGHREALVAFLDRGERGRLLGTSADLPGFLALILDSPYGAMA